MKRGLTVFLVLLMLLAVGAPTGFAAKEGGGAFKAYREEPLTGGVYEGTQLGVSGLVLDPAALQAGTDTTARYNGGAYHYGRYTAPVQAVSFAEAIASWRANTPAGTWVEVEMRAQVAGVWTKWYSMGVWLEGDTPFKRHSVSGQADQDGYVATDTLILDKAAAAVQTRVTLFTVDPAVTPTVRGYGATYSSGTDKPGVVPFSGLTSDLAVPKRSQMVFPDGGEVWCSPTSTSMVMAYWAAVTGNAAYDQTVPTVVKGVWDYKYNGGGNWPYNTGYAASFGLESKVVRLSSMAEVEQWTAAGVPVIASIAYKKGELTGSPIPSSGGHLLVIRGFDAAGNVLTNDPAAATDAEVAITYDRLELEQTWLNNSNGVVYLIYPTGWAVPASNGRW